MKKLKLLTQEQKKFWDDNGYVQVSGIFTPTEMEEMSKAYDDIFERKQKENVAAMESAWVGDEMKKAANNMDYTVSFINNNSK